MPRKCLILVVAAMLVASILPATATADKPPLIPAFFDDQIVFFTVVSENVVGVDNPGMEKHAIPLYSFGPPGMEPQPDVLAAIPGVKGYNPWWIVIAVIPTDGRDVTTNPYTSEAEILAAATAGDVLLIDTDFFFLCQVLPRRRT